MTDAPKTPEEWAERFKTDVPRHLQSYQQEVADALAAGPPPPMGHFNCRGDYVEPDGTVHPAQRVKHGREGHPAPARWDARRNRFTYSPPEPTPWDYVKDWRTWGSFVGFAGLCALCGAILIALSIMLGG